MRKPPAIGVFCSTGEATTKRRTLLLLASATLVPPCLAFGQARKFRVLVLHSAPIPSGPYHNALREQLRAHGFVEGKNLTLDAPAVTVGGREYMRRDFARLLANRPDAILAFSSTVTHAAVAEAPAVPLVFAWVADPVKEGLARDYARPGGSATGVSNRSAEVAVKRLELLRELAPAIRRVAIVGPTYEPEGEAALAALRPASQHMRIQLIEVGTTITLQVPEVRNVIQKGAEAILPLHVFSAFGARAAGQEIARLCAAHRVPAIFAESEMVEAGALASYGTRLLDDVRRAADMLARVLHGAKPGEMAIDQVSQFELAVNLKTARETGIRVPPGVLARASRIVQ